MTLHRRRRASALAALSAGILHACGDSGGPPREEEYSLAAVAGPAAAASASDSLFSLGMEMYDEFEMDSARVLFSLARDRAREAADQAAEARALTRLGLVAWRLGEHAEARRVGEAALELKSRAGLQDQLFDSYNALGLLAWHDESRYREALETFRRAEEVALAVADTEGLAKAWSNLGNVHTELGEFEEASRLFPRALEAARRVESLYIEGRVLTNLGMLAVRTGDPSSAVPYLQRGRARSREAEDWLGEQSAVAHLGTAYAALGDIGRAIAHLDSALADVRARGLRQEEASNLEQLAELHLQAGDFAGALRFLEEARELNTELDLLDELGADLRSEAQIHATIGNPDLAHRRATEALEIHRGVGARLEVLGDLLMLAELADELGNRDESDARLREARDLARDLDAPVARAAVALSRARIADRRGAPDVVFEALHGAAADLATAGPDAQWEAHTLTARAFRRTGALDSAVAAGRRAIDIVEKVRGRLGAGLLRTSYTAERVDAYRDLVDVLLAAGRIEEAFEVADGSRGRALLDELATRGTDGERDGDAPLRQLAEEERQILTTIDALVVRIAAARETAGDEGVAGRRAELDRLYEELERKREAYSAALMREEARAGAGRDLLGGVQPSIARIRSALRPGEAMLQYMVLPDRVLLFLLDSDSIRLVGTPVPRTQLAAQVRIVRELLGRPGGELDGASAATVALFDALVRPAIEAGVFGRARTLVIVPDGELGYLPFAALRDSTTGRYVAETHALLHVPSAGALPALRTRAAMDASGDAAVFAPFPDDLPATEEEAKTFREAVPGSDAVRGRRATEARFREALARSPIVHAATHGVMNARNPLFSRLELAPDGGGRSENDGRLEVHELLGTPVVAGLVFLSGCETGVGAAWATGFSRGEDYATLARAFLYAGAENVVATLWRVEDEGAAAFAAAFYAALAEGGREVTSPSADGRAGPRADVADALARAQRTMLADPRYASPYHWAGYQVSGGGRSPALASR